MSLTLSGKTGFALFVALLVRISSAAAGLPQTEVLGPENVEVCYNYSCLDRSLFVLEQPFLSELRYSLPISRSAEQERRNLAYLIGRFYSYADQKLPIVNDRAGNWADQGNKGRMDCIDHATTTTSFLLAVQWLGLLRYHHVVASARRVRGVIFQHYSAVIAENSIVAEKNSQPIINAAGFIATQGNVNWTRAWGNKNKGLYVLDSWMVNHGKPAVLLPLNEWLDGGGINVN